MNLLFTPTERRALRRVIGLCDIRPGRFLTAVLFGSLALGSAVALSAVSAWLIARASQQPPVLFLMVATTSVRMFGVGRAVFRYCNRLASHYVALRGMDALRLGLYDRLSVTGVQRTVGLHRGDLLARTGADVDDVGDFVVKSLLPACVAGVVSVATVIGIAFLSPVAALILAVFLLISGVISPLLSAHAARLSEEQTVRARSDLSDASLTIMEGASELQVTGRVAGLLSEFGDAQRRLEDATARAARISGLAAAVNQLAMGGAVIGALLVGIPQTTAGQIAAVALAVLVLTPLAAFEGPGDMAGAATQAVRSASAAVRIDELLGHEDVPASHPLPEDATSGGLVARGLSIGWEGGPVVAHDIDLSLTPGKSVAVVGPSGIGKSTLLYTLAGLIPPRGGSATLNGIDVWAMDRDDLTSLLTMTAEDAHVFSTTLLENLRVGNPDESPEGARQMLERVNLSEWADALPGGIDTLLGSGGTTISGGERRRLLIARELETDSLFMLVDEPTEHLDGDNADRVMELLDGLKDEGHGILIVTHHLSGLDRYDEVVILDHDAGTGTDAPSSQIIARGTHDQLLATQPAYRRALEQENRT